MSKTSHQEVDLDQIHHDLITIAKQAGQTIRLAHPPTSTSTSTSPGIDTKKNSADLVTETDRAVEHQISTYLLTKYPTFEFLGEETYQPGMKLGDAPTFVVDPIDGTTNFVHGYPWVSVSLGFAVNRQPVVGVVFNPFTGITYTGIKSRGSFREEFDFIPSSSSSSSSSNSNSDPTSNAGSRSEPSFWAAKKNPTTNQPVRYTLPLKQPTALTGLDGTLVAVEWGSDRTGTNWSNKIKTWDNLGRSRSEGGAMVHSARCLGSAALNMCAVAEGVIDVYWEGGCWAWDVCAAWVVVIEAGGVVVDGNPGEWDIPVDHRKYLVVRGAEGGQKELVEEFWGHVVGRMEYES